MYKTEPVVSGFVFLSSLIYDIDIKEVLKMMTHADFSTFKTMPHKEIMMFSITPMSSDYTANMNFLISRMYKVAKSYGIDVKIHMDSASKIERRGKEADIILLTPELFAMKDEIQAKLPDKIVKVIDRKDYGFLNGEHVLWMALSS